ncbi:acyl-CoA dehydrogenase family protein [Amycolatopsis sp. FDAARGOS 1241]|uniref:acyl-CoA dehydrogenase family protein n=1 Tax=Amycolatopsis sp. FDAARGOS 1241 TaxID=2778070 RepID=UPI0019517607|nr:hypothetical protein I6J71_13030 [Amycolatopsis sp. FDAARGOS 1241]
MPRRRRPPLPRVDEDVRPLPHRPGRRCDGRCTRAYGFARDYARQRTQFGKPIIEYQAVAFPRPDVATRNEASCCFAPRAGPPRRPTASDHAAELRAPETAVTATGTAVQTRWRVGCSREYPSNSGCATRNSK